MGDQPSGKKVRMKFQRYDKSGYDYAEVPEGEVTHWRKQGGQVAPEQNVGEFASKATQSFHPSTIKEGVQRMVTDPIGMARDLGQLPYDLASEGVDEFKQGNLLRGGRKMFEAALPIAGGVAGGAGGFMAAGPFGVLPGMVAGYMGGAGVASGADASTEYAEQDLNASAAGAAVDAGIQGALGVRSARPRTATNAAQTAQNLDRRTGNMMARTIGPTVGPDRYAWGNEARRLGQQILRKTTGGSVDDMGQQIHDFKERANAGLDAAYDTPQSVAGAPAGPAGQGRVRMPTADVRAALQDRIDALSSRWRNGNWEPYEGNAAVVSQLKKAMAELDRQPTTLGPKEIRKLRQSWDKLAEYENVKESTVGWHRLRPQGTAYRVARDVLNDKTVETFPHLEPHIADAALGIQADKLFKVFQETENARSRVARGSLAMVGGSLIGQSIGGTFGTGVGALAGPALEYFATQKVLPAVKIKAARLMTELADELRKNGQSSKAVTYAQQLQQLAQPVGPTIRAAEAMQGRQIAAASAPPPVAPEQAAAAGISPGGWFDSVMKRGQ